MPSNTWQMNIARTLQPKGRLGNADPRIEAIQMLKASESVDLLFRGGSEAGFRAHEELGDGYADSLNAGEGVIVSHYVFRPEWADA